jgi:uncharacterized protein YhbP (UPF0306 family)
MDVIETTLRILLSQRYLSLGTVGNGQPWVCALAYTVEPDLSFVFYSARDSIHCQNLYKNPGVAGAIFDSSAPSDVADGLQFQGTASEVEESELQAVMNRYFETSFPDPAIRSKWQRPAADFLGAAPQRFYRIRPRELFKLDTTSTIIDRRAEVDMAALLSLARAEAHGS